VREAVLSRLAALGSGTPDISADGMAPFRDPLLKNRALNASRSVCHLCSDAYLSLGYTGRARPFLLGLAGVLGGFLSNVFTDCFRLDHLSKLLALLFLPGLLAIWKTKRCGAACLLVLPLVHSFGAIRTPAVSI